MKDYQRIAIVESGEPLVAIPADRVCLISPHPYAVLGAPYGDKSPFYLRAGVLAALLQAQTKLEQSYPGWKIQIFDAYRPIAVQQFMVDYTFSQLVQARGFGPENLTDGQKQTLLEQVYEFWAVPSADPTTPPPHSTGAALDVTLVNAAGTPIEMGSEIDEISPRSYPDHFAGHSDETAQRYDRHRQLLAACMESVGFTRHPREWWHFSLGDQMWAWLNNQQRGRNLVARYGSIA